MKKLFALFLLLLTPVVSHGCALDTEPREVNAVDIEALGTCWDTLVVGSQPNFPPYDVMSAAVAMKQWVGGSWKPCTCDSQLLNCTCPRLIGPGRVQSHWVGYLNGHPQIAVVNYPTTDMSADRNEVIYPSDWDDDVFYHASVTAVGGYDRGSIAITHYSGNTWNLHHCLSN